MKLRKRVKVRLSPFYRRYPPDAPVAHIKNRATISKAYGFAYFRVPKAANSSVLMSLCEAMGYVDTGSKPEIDEIKRRGFYKPYELSMADVRALESEYFLFAFVRNPFSRVVSAYLDKVASGHEPRIREKVESYLERARGSEISFPEFLDFLSANNNIKSDAHWMPQETLLTLPIDKFSYIGNIETFGDDMATIMKRIFGGGNTELCAPHGTSASKKVHDFVGEAEKKKIVSLYARDFELLGYPKDQLPAS